MALARDVRERLTLPAFAAPMFLCSGVELASECCKAGIIGSLTRNHCRDLAELEAQLKTVSEALAARRRGTSRTQDRPACRQHLTHLRHGGDEGPS